MTILHMILNMLVGKYTKSAFKMLKGVKEESLLYSLIYCSLRRISFLFKLVCICDALWCGNLCIF